VKRGLRIRDYDTSTFHCRWPPKTATFSNKHGELVDTIERLKFPEGSQKDFLASTHRRALDRLTRHGMNAGLHFKTNIHHNITYLRVGAIAGRVLNMPELLRINVYTSSITFGKILVRQLPRVSCRAEATVPPNVSQGKCLSDAVDIAPFTLPHSPAQAGDRKERTVSHPGCLEFTRGNSKENSPFLSTTYHTITCRTNFSLLIPVRVTKPTNHSEPTEHHSSYGLGCNLSDPRRDVYWSGRWSRPQVFDRTGSCIEHAPPVSVVPAIPPWLFI
jgi:hypothetical protein